MQAFKNITTPIVNTKEINLTYNSKSVKQFIAQAKNTSVSLLWQNATHHPA